jgi:DNA-directed RNA polymerase I subunit RPA12
MAAIGSLVFCTDCGNLLENNTSRKTYLNCEVCGAQNKGMHREIRRLNPHMYADYEKDTSSKTISTASKPTAFPSSLRTRLRSDVQEYDEGEIQTDAIIDHPCEKCGNPQTRYYTQQLRSADEGSTVFYTCPKCSHKWNENN